MGIETEPEFQSKLDWMKMFVQEEIEPLDVLWPHDVYRRPMDPDVEKVIRPLQRGPVKDCGPATWDLSSAVWHLGN